MLFFLGLIEGRKLNNVLQVNAPSSARELSLLSCIYDSEHKAPDNIYR